MEVVMKLGMPPHKNLTNRNMVGWVWLHIFFSCCAPYYCYHIGQAAIPNTKENRKEKNIQLGICVKYFLLFPQKNRKIYGTIQKTETPKFYKLKTTKLHKMHNTFKLRIKGTKTTMVYKLRDGARSENLRWRVVMWGA